MPGILTILVLFAVFNALLLVFALTLTTLTNIPRATIWRVIVWCSAASLLFAMFGIIVSWPQL